MNLDPVLIYTDTRSIIQKKAFLTKIIPVVQGIYHAFQTINIDVPLSALTPLLYGVLKDSNVTGMTESYVKGILVAELGSQNFNNIKVDLSSHVVVPNVSLIVARLNAYQNVSDQTYIYEPQKLQVVNGVVSKSLTADAEITDMYTYYSQNDKGAEFTAIVFDLAEKLNYYRTYLKVPPGNNLYFNDVHGLEKHNNTYRPDLRTIRQMEQSNWDYIAPDPEA